LNNMNIRPLYDRIVVKRIEDQETMRNGIVIPDSAKEKPQEGEVLAVGRGKMLEDGRSYLIREIFGLRYQTRWNGIHRHARRRGSRRSHRGLVSTNDKENTYG
jgi:hypothetical protein